MESSRQCLCDGKGDSPQPTVEPSPPPEATRREVHDLRDVISSLANWATVAAHLARRASVEVGDDLDLAAILERARNAGALEDKGVLTGYGKGREAILDSMVALATDSEGRLVWVRQGTTVFEELGGAYLDLGGDVSRLRDLFPWTTWVGNG